LVKEKEFKLLSQSKIKSEKNNSLNKELKDLYMERKKLINEKY